MLLTENGYIVKIADEHDEYNQIYDLNYKTFVEEIPQHSINDKKQLIDKFNEQNKYIIVKKDNAVLGMVALRDKRPFSLDYKLENLTSYLPVKDNIIEVRLLSVNKQLRNSKILILLLKGIIANAANSKYKLAIISGILNQQNLYTHLGFKPFGPLVGNENAKFQPMYLTKDNFENVMVKLVDFLILKEKKELNNNKNE